MILEQAKTVSLSGVISALLCAGILCSAQRSAATEQPGRRFEDYRRGFNRDVLTLQILLDRQHLSCNCLDGVWGARTQIALMTWQVLRGREPTGIPDATILSELGDENDALHYHTITAAEVAALGTVPQEWEARAQMPSLPYETLQELLAERGHTSQRCLERLNPHLPWPNPPVGTQVLLPHCPADKPVRLSSMRISLGRTEITLFNAAGELCALFPCSIARDKAKRPAGEVRVSVVAANPNYTYDSKLFLPGATNHRRLIIPPGPNNPVGLAWIGLSLQGYGVHGTPTPEQIGRAESKGCFRVANWNATKLLQMVEIGMPVIIEE